MVKEKRKNAPPEKVVLEKLAKLAGVLMKVLRIGVKRLQTVLGRSKKES